MAPLVRSLTLVALAVVLLAGQFTGAAAGVPRDQWYRVTLEQGETQGYRWAVGAKGPRGGPLKDSCLTVGVLEPPQPDADYVEGHDFAVCGGLIEPGDSISLGTPLGSGESALTLFAALYRPVVRELTFLLDTGERRVLQPRLADIPDRQDRGIPRFRYVVADFEAGICIRKLTSRDGSGSVIRSEVSPFCL